MSGFIQYVDVGVHFVCLPCRRSMKRKAPYVWNENAAPMEPKMKMEKVICPECRGEMICFGKKFTPPPRRDLRQWKKLEWLINEGWCGYHWPINPKMNLRSAQESLAVAIQTRQILARKKKEGDALLQRRRTAKAKLSFSKVGQKRLKAELKRQKEYQTAVLEAIANNSASPTPTSPTP